MMLQAKLRLHALRLKIEAPNGRARVREVGLVAINSVESARALS